MFELVPSLLMRGYYEEIGFEFTDRQKATLIWNASKKREEILGALKELEETTNDEDVRRQILERLCFEERIFTAFISNPNSEYVYVVEDREGDSCGFFADYFRAKQYAEKYAKANETKCSVAKQLIIKTAEDEIVRNPWRANPNMGVELDEYVEYEGTAVARAFFDSDGEVERLYSNELSEEEAGVDGYRPDRFENSFIKVPFPLAAGTPVKDIVRGTYGVLAQGKEEWDSYVKCIEDKKLYADYFDMQVVVYELAEEGYWSHHHINPMHLEVEFPPYIPGDEKRNSLRRATEAFGEYLDHKSRGSVYCPNLVLKYAEEYASVCHEEDFWEKRVKEAKTPEDIMV